MIGSALLFDFYHVLVFVHVAAVIAWVGGDLMLTLLAQQVRGTGTAGDMTALLGRIERFSKTFFAPLSVVVLLSGLGMGIIGDILAARWISIGFLGIFVSAGIGMGYLVPKSRQLRALIDQHGVDHPEVVRLGDRMLLVSRIELTILALVIAVMAFKPGAV